MKPQIRSERKKLLHTLENILEAPMIFLGFVWLALLVVELVWGLSPLLQTASLVIWALFIVDFLLKFVLAPDKLLYFKRNVFTAISLLIPALRIFRVLRFLRVFRGVRLIRVVSSLNRTMKSLGATMKRRGFGYVVMLSLLVTFGGAAGMYAAENGNPGFESYGLSLYWTAMRVITAGNEYWPVTSEGRALAFFIAIFGYAIFGYVTATLATFFIGRDAANKEAPMASAKDVAEIKTMINNLTRSPDQAQKNSE